MRLNLDLSRHCIETELKRQHHLAVTEYFRAPEEKKEGLEEVIELTRSALEKLDFNQLRSAHRPLSGGTGVAVMITLRGGRLEIVVDQTVVEIPCK